MTTSDGVLDLVQCWAAAEQQDDAGLLEGLLADDFAGLGSGPLRLPARRRSRREAGAGRTTTMSQPGYGPGRTVLGRDNTVTDSS
jgi:hypothetical protein